MAGIYQGAWTGPEIDEAIGRSSHISNRNLLDNWYFENPVNQRGNSSGQSQGVFVGQGYTIDRWKNSLGGTIAVVSGGVNFGYALSSFGYNIIQQFFEKPSLIEGKTVTVSCVVDNLQFSKTGYIPSDNSYWDCGSTAGLVRVYKNRLEIIQNNTTSVWKAIKLELGNAQSLAHQEQGNVVLNEIPDYGTELTKCQRYYVPYAEGSLSGSLYGAQLLYFVVPVPVQMANNPTVGTLSVKYNGGDITSNYNQTPAYTARPGHIFVQVSSGSSRSFGTAGAYGVSLQNISADL